MRPLNVREAGDVCILTLDDQSSVNDGQSDVFRQALYQAIEARQSSPVLLDLGQIEFLSSSGVALLVSLRKRIGAANGRLIVFGMKPYVEDLLRGMRLLPLFQVVADEAAAHALL